MQGVERQPGHVYYPVKLQEQSLSLPFMVYIIFKRYKIFIIRNG